jgi:hypothetical protein
MNLVLLIIVCLAYNEKLLAQKKADVKRGTKEINHKLAPPQGN